MKAKKQPHPPKSIHAVDTFPTSNVWGLEEGKVAKGDPKQPDSQKQDKQLFFANESDLKIHIQRSHTGYPDSKPKYMS